MSATRKMYDAEFRKNAVKLSYASNKSVGHVAKDLGISDGMLYRWRAKYTPEGDKTRYATLEEENIAPTLQATTSEICVPMRPNGLSSGKVGGISGGIDQLILQLAEHARRAGRA